MENITGIEVEDHQINQINKSDDPFNDMENSSDEDSDQEKEWEDRRCSIIYDHKEEHMPKEELAMVAARYIPVQSSAWMVVNEQFIFHRTQQELARKTWRKTVRWSCSGKRKYGCLAKALTHWLPREGAKQPQPNCPVDLVYIWRNQLHTCNLNSSRNIFLADLKTKMKQCWLENPTWKYRAVFEESKAALISRIYSKDLRKKLRKECKMESHKTWFHRKLLKQRKDRSVSDDHQT